MRFQKTWIPIALSILGLTPSAAVCAQARQQQGGRAQQEQQRGVSLNSVPDPVRRTVEKEAEGGQVIKINRIEQKGRTYYEAWIQKGKDNFGSVIDESGKVVRYEQSEQKKKAEQNGKNNKKARGGGPPGAKHDKKQNNDHKSAQGSK